MLTALRLIARHPTRGKQSLVAARPVHADQIVASYMVPEQQALPACECKCFMAHTEPFPHTLRPTCA